MHEINYELVLKDSGEKHIQLKVRRDLLQKSEVQGVFLYVCYEKTNGNVESAKGTADVHVNQQRSPSYS